MKQRIGFARWRSDLASGGNRYDDELAVALRALGLDVREYPVPGSWPVPKQQERERLSGLLAAEQDWLIDNIIGSAEPEVISAAVESGRRVTMLIHYFPADDPALSQRVRKRLTATEAQAVEAADTVVVTSSWAADQVAARYGRGDAVVAIPGVAPAELAIGSARAGNPPMLLWLGRLTQTKDPLTFIAALSRLQDFEWTAQLVGSDKVDDDLSREVRERIDQAGLSYRVTVLGQRSGDALASVWAKADLLVHTSRTETYGMVITEALARGIPAIVPAGTGAVEAQGVGESFPPGDADALSAVLHGWLSDPELRQRWRDEAEKLRLQLPTWADTARIVAAALPAGASTVG
ncbi:MAG: glycosyltransferase family 4 protein [Propionibacteriaceae bacterium]|jgi:glycosyltransferase involved in cell wall biosynthesis|nr:glycosyltransferase family 4 protein [Propionibacteriaceae bacterium]